MLRAARIVPSLLVLMLCVTAGAEPPAAPQAGMYAGDGLKLKLERDGNQYRGVAELGQTKVDLRGSLDSAKGVAGTFESGGSHFTWKAVATAADSLTFSTGGADYHVKLQSENPSTKKSSPNPLANQHASPAPAAAPATAAGAGLVKFTRLSIKDPGINNIEAISFLVPQGWQPDGGIKWFPDYSILANLLMKVTDSTSGAQVEFLPIQNFTWMEQQLVPMQQGSNYAGNIFLQPISDPRQFIRAIYMPQVLRHLAGAKVTGVDDLKQIANQVVQSYGGQLQAKAARVGYEYQRDGKPWREDVYVTLVFVPPLNGIHIWSVSSAYAFRAPKDQFEQLLPTMQAMVGTLRVSPNWFCQYMYVQKLFMERMNNGVRNARALSDTLTRNNEEIRKMFNDSYKQRCEAEDRVSQKFSEYIRGVETYKNPYENRPVQLPSGYENAWVNANGEYILSTQASYDPNVGSNAEWRRMDRSH